MVLKTPAVALSPFSGRGGKLLWELGRVGHSRAHGCGHRAGFDGPEFGCLYSNLCKWVCLQYVGFLCGPRLQSSTGASVQLPVPLLALAGRQLGEEDGGFILKGTSEGLTAVMRNSGCCSVAEGGRGSGGERSLLGSVSAG